MKRTTRQTRAPKPGGIPRLGPRNRRAKVEPLKDKRAGGGGDYDYGFTPPPERDPWVDEGRPETAG
jgi:hypothetical protein